MAEQKTRDEIAADARASALSAIDARDTSSWWASEREDKAVFNALSEAGLLTPEPGLAWYDENFKKPRYRFKAVRQAGFPHGAVSRDWLKDNASEAGEFLDALREAGQLTAEPGKDWYAAAFLRGKEYDDEGKTWRCKFVEALIETGLIADCDAEWLGSKLNWSDSLLPALRTAGVLTSIKDRDFFVRKFHLSRDLLDALRESGLLTPECGRKWYRDAFSKTCADGGWRKSTCRRGISVCDDMDARDYADKAIFEAGLYPKESPPSRRYLSAAFEGEALFDALVEHGHMNDHRGLTWYTARFKGDLLVRAMKASGLWDKAGRKWCVRHLTGAQQAQYCEEHGDSASWYMCNDESSYRASTENPWSGRTSDGSDS
jgi:hypothetical protein